MIGPPGKSCHIQQTTLSIVQLRVREKGSTLDRQRDGFQANTQLSSGKKNLSIPARHNRADRKKKLRWIRETVPDTFSYSVQYWHKVCCQKVGFNPQTLAICPGCRANFSRQTSQTYPSILDSRYCSQKADIPPVQNHPAEYLGSDRDSLLRFQLED